jgi:peptide/nickel transport system substrate-binding protein
MARNRGPGVDPKSPDAGVPVPALAESWELAPEGNVVTFKLRPNVKWHPIAPVNGRVMDIDDWKTTHERFLASGESRLPMADVLDKAEFPDARTMVWRLKYPYAPMLSRIWSRFTYMVLPKELNGNVPLAEQTAIGTGYKVLDKHQRAITMEYRKHVDYWGGEPFIDRWHAPIIPEYSNQYAQFVNGNIIDFAPTARDVLLLAKDAPQTVIVAADLPDDNISRIRFGRNNNKTLPWKDPRVRVALRRSMNMRGIAEFMSNQKQFEAAGIQIEIAPRTHLTRNPAYWLDPEKGELGALSANYLYDVAEAKKLMVAAGFNDAVDIDYHVLPSGDGVVPEQDQLVIDSLNQSGLFRVTTVRSVNTVAHRNCRSLGQCDGLVQSSTSEDADFIIYRDYHSLGNTEGEQAYPDPRIDRVAEAQRKEMDVPKRMELLKEFQMIAAELMPAIPYIHQYTSFRFRWPWLHNVNYGSAGGGLPEGRPVLGGHLHWLDANMPNRERGAS